MFLRYENTNKSMIIPKKVFINNFTSACDIKICTVTHEGYVRVVAKNKSICVRSPADVLIWRVLFSVFLDVQKDVAGYSYAGFTVLLLPWCFSSLWWGNISHHKITWGCIFKLEILTEQLTGNKVIEHTKNFQVIFPLVLHRFVVRG